MGCVMHVGGVHVADVCEQQQNLESRESSS